MFEIAEASQDMSDLERSRFKACWIEKKGTKRIEKFQPCSAGCQIEPCTESKIVFQASDTDSSCDHSRLVVAAGPISGVNIISDVLRYARAGSFCFTKPIQYATNSLWLAHVGVTAAGRCGPNHSN